jgi:soluble lytic murein transglycosylase-like protein
MMHFIDVSGEVENPGLSHEVHEAVEEDTVPADYNLLFTQSRLEGPDFILERYRDPQAQEQVIVFFASICASEDIATAILANANEFDISPALAAALAWEESRFNPLALNTRNRDGSVDRGLFQLNSQSFPRLELQIFFNPYTNARYAMGHLRHCLDTGGSVVAALAMYNAGTKRVNSAGTPKSTLDYASRILLNSWEIENLFREQETWLVEQPETAEIAEEKQERSRLVPLIPLAGK